MVIAASLATHTDIEISLISRSILPQRLIYIWKRIEVVITASLATHTDIEISLISCSILPKAQFNMEAYRSGHNGTDSKFCSHFGTSHLKSLDL